MIEISDYIFNEEDEEEISELEAMGYRSYIAEDGSSYMVDPNAPEEADYLASAAAQGDIEAIDEITGYKNPFEVKSSKSKIGNSNAIKNAASIK
jgi:formylmethanofuran:tetrahydromethanopterin formyltransferase